MPPLSQHLSHESTATLHPPSTSVFGFKLSVSVYTPKDEFLWTKLSTSLFPDKNAGPVAKSFKEAI